MIECENYIAPMNCLTVTAQRYAICQVCIDSFTDDLHEGTTASDAPRDSDAA